MSINRPLTVHVKIIIPPSVYRDVFDEISYSGVGSIRFHVRECQREVHGSVPPTELHEINVKSIHPIN